ncbi:MAG TPA: undecaprenyldiphospho-muramoylpentapeptide beta-N-acetylglucosaminyltransferase [Pseudogracilibacillus sp.]|nr:undecaprenyldiphospho-muramoylpentapeptide beta-N-acetylglucosaminyltransferase [Pseudogracilibacillus sp.]
MADNHILFTGGGTAGHVIVNLALIPYFEEKGWQIDYIGSKDGIEKELVEDIPSVTYHAISTGKLRRYLSLDNIKDPFKVMKGILQSWNILRKKKIDVVFSKGGFVSVPVVIAARLKRVPTIIHESDLTPGLANKIASKFAKKIVTTFPETVNYLPNQKTEHAGAVIRQELYEGDPERGHTLLNGNTGKPVLLIMGGSIGSQNINETIRKNITNLLENYQIVHICGKNNIDDSIQQEGYTQFEYVQEELKHIFSITDLVVSRAGANAIYEFLAMQLPMLLIPLSRAASRGDQIDNAKSFSNQGFANVLYEEDLTSDSFLRAIQQLSENATTIKVAMQEQESSEAEEKVLRLIQELKK